MRNQKPVFFAFCLGMTWLLTGCMTTAQEREMSDLQMQVDTLQKQTKQREQQLSSATQTSQSVQTELDALKSQNATLQGGVDELKMRIQKIEETAGSTSEVSKNDASGESSPLIERRLVRLELLNAENVPKTAKLPAKLKDLATLEKLLKTDFDNSRFDDVVKIASLVINSSDAKPQAVALALEYRGEAKFNQRNYRGAALDLSSFIESFPSHKRYPRALLLAGDSFFYLKKAQVALSYYTECKGNYASTAEGKAAAGRMVSLMSQLGGARKSAVASLDAPAQPVAEVAPQHVAPLSHAQGRPLPETQPPAAAE